MVLSKENTTRKVDSLGRVSIPKSLRDRLNIIEGEEVEFYLLETDDGVQYVCLTNQKVKTSRYAVALSVLEELGLDVPTELEEML